MGVMIGWEQVETGWGGQCSSSLKLRPESAERRSRGKRGKQREQPGEGPVEGADLAGSGAARSWEAGSVVGAQGRGEVPSRQGPGVGTLPPQ